MAAQLAVLLRVLQLLDGTARISAPRERHVPQRYLDPRFRSNTHYDASPSSDTHRRATLRRTLVSKLTALDADLGNPLANGIDTTHLAPAHDYQRLAAKRHDPPAPLEPRACRRLTWDRWIATRRSRLRR